MQNTAKVQAKPDWLSQLHHVDVGASKYHGLKRAMDFCIALVATIILFIPMVILLLCVYIDDPGKVIFAQARIGRDAKPFHIYKIRTMIASAPGNMSADEFRDASRFVTRMGKFLRKSSLDELPQLINVLKGDMSIIGPRPLIAEESRIHKLRLNCGVYQTRPGITGLAQINGRNNISTAEKVWWEVKYLENFGLKQDLKILFGTLPKILLGADVNKNFDAEH